MAESFLLKNVLNPNLIAVMGRNIKSVFIDFDEKRFYKGATKILDDLELKERAKMISDQLRLALPESYPVAIDILVRSMAIDLKDKDGFGRYMELYFLPYAEFIARYGLEHLEESKAAMYALTKVFTSEFCIRPFIERYPEEMMQTLKKWVVDGNHHVRRLVSEGTRPRLPWASRLPAFQKDPRPVLELLEHLKDDPELYVRRSVANNLNDIAKDHPDLVLELLKRWKRIDNAGTQYIVRHATRTLIKDGHNEALILLGFDPKAPVSVTTLTLDNEVRFGNDLSFEFELKNTGTQANDFVVDFVIYFMKSNKSLAPKVFKLKTKHLAAGEAISIQKKHPIKPISTRKYYDGTHHLAIQVNGIERIRKPFELIDSTH